jgi:formyltetrahydrofolate-dependent phosphoribosylglycinamide formyltransferase
MTGIAILVGAHGRGSNMAALAEACLRGDLPCRVATVIGARAEAPAMERGRSLGLPTDVVPAGGPGYGRRLVETLRARGAEWVCLAGYMRLLPTEVLDAYPRRVLNIHPALLPKHGGKGMYGEHVHRAVLASGDAQSGCTVHYVAERYDEGEVLLQLRCPVEPGDTPQSLAARVLELEHRAYWAALKEAMEREGAGAPQA